LQADDGADPVVHIFLDTITDNMVSGCFNVCTRPEIVALLLRIIATIDSRENLERLSLAILQSSGEVAGKVLWTLAGCLIDKCDFSSAEACRMWTDILYLVGRTLLSCSNLKAKWQLARVCKSVIMIEDCPASLRLFLQNQMKSCLTLLECLDPPLSVDPDAFQRYYVGLESELSIDPPH
jgi:hypothetical protein